ncbi:MAG: acyloxyacyl hydrolase [Parcubacteria group bacterium]|nr:acyloxyacyl hydrolase [Parcubacteria group bacterium]MBI3075267.1 acyloxyacyl hydrolase [Parcubacteria group bacterium]
MRRKLGWALFTIAVLIFTASQTAFAEPRTEVQLGKGVVSEGAQENYFLFLSHRPEELQKDWRLHYGVFGGKDGKVYNIVGFDWYMNAYVPYDKGASPLVQVGVGLSFFDKLTPNLGSQLELHIFGKLGGVKGNQYYALSADHWSNGGLTKNNDGENFLSITWGIFWK